MRRSSMPPAGTLILTPPGNDRASVRTVVPAESMARDAVLTACDGAGGPPEQAGDRQRDQRDRPQPACRTRLAPYCWWNVSTHHIVRGPQVGGRRTRQKRIEAGGHRRRERSALRLQPL